MTQLPRWASAGAESLLEEQAGERARVATGGLHPNCVGLLQAPVQPARGLVLALHGWSAGPYQYSQLAQQLSDSGLAIWAPRLPGHGARRAGREDPSDLPTADNWRDYGSFASQTLARARTWATAQGLPLYLSGFSMGGALALDMLGQAPEACQRLLWLAPLLRPYGLWPRLQVRMLRLAAAHGRQALFDTRPTGWGTEATLPPERAGHWRFPLGALYAAIEYAHQVALRVQRLPVPCQLILTAADRTCDPAAAMRLWRTAPRPRGCAIFPRAQGVPHAMLGVQDNPDPVSRTRVEAIALAFLGQGDVTDQA